MKKLILILLSAAVFALSSITSLAAEHEIVAPRWDLTITDLWDDLSMEYKASYTGDNFVEIKYQFLNHLSTMYNQLGARLYVDYVATIFDTDIFQDSMPESNLTKEKLQSFITKNSQTFSAANIGCRGFLASLNNAASVLIAPAGMVSNERVLALQMIWRFNKEFFTQYPQILEEPRPLTEAQNKNENLAFINDNILFIMKAPEATDLDLTFEGATQPNNRSTEIDFAELQIEAHHKASKLFVRITSKITDSNLLKQYFLQEGKIVMVSEAE
jgi:hypothetical protein